MGGSRAQVNKAHKTRFSSKATRHLHKISGADKGRISKSNSRIAANGSRAARVQRSKMVRDKKRTALLKDKRVSTGSSSPPRVIVLFGLSSFVNLNSLARDLLMLLSGDDADNLSTTVASSSYKFRTTVLMAPHGDLQACMELAKVADAIAFVVSANSFFDGCETGGPIDLFGTHCLSVFRAMGLPSTVVLLRDLPVDMKSKLSLKKAAVSSLASEVPEDCKFYLADTKDELHKFLWIFKEQHFSDPHWRNERSYLISQEVGVEADNSNTGLCTLLLSGYLRAHSLSVNQLVHVSGVGDFQLGKIDVLKDPFPINERKGFNSMDSEDTSHMLVMRSLLPDLLNQEPLLVENTPDPLSGEQTWPTEADIAEAAANNRHKSRKRKLPRGTSDYQAAWIVDSDDDGSDHIGEDDDGMVLDDGPTDPLVDEESDFSDCEERSHDIENFDEETEADTDMLVDDSLTKEQIEAEIQKVKAAHADDEGFPDEVDTPTDIPAKKRFTKYRGLKSFRTSSWDPKESLPPEYARIFSFDNFAKTQKHVRNKIEDIDKGDITVSAAVGLYVRLHIKQVPIDFASKVCNLSKRLPVVAYGLLQHESKMSVLHFSIKKHSSYADPIKSKEELIFHAGFRQFMARPLFSSDNINCDKHKMEKFLHEGRFSVASVYAPICFPPLPLIVLKALPGEPPSIVATGTLRSVDPDRIILKKIILTGFPQRVSKLKATVRFMFHNPDDVRWFKPVDVWTKLGRRGRIKDSVGMHGAMKCTFNGVVQQHDTVCMGLYKRAYPKWPERLCPPPPL